MLVIDIRERFHVRAVEWGSGLAMIGVGVFFTLWPLAFERYGLSGFSRIAPVNTWIVASIVFGLLRIGALILNGRRPDISAPVRFTCTALGGGLFAAILVALLEAADDQGPPLLAVFVGMFFLGEVYSAVRSGKDSYHALVGEKAWMEP